MERHGEGRRFETWVERQIREATERGEFDNLPGAGQPIPGSERSRRRRLVGQGFLEREKISPPLPTTLALRREIADLPETLADVPDEQSVREIVADLNERIRDTHRRRVDGPPVVLRLVDVDRAVADWVGPPGLSLRAGWHNRAMPQSSAEGKDWTRERIEGLAADGPVSVLDIGPGVGTYAKLLAGPHVSRLTGIEIWEPYVHTYRLRHVLRRDHRRRRPSRRAGRRPTW